jgi:predicted nucleic acid-binding protein
VVEVVTGEARVMFPENSAPTSVKVTSPFSWFGQMEENIRQRVYIETTIPSFYYEVRTEPEMIARRNWTRAWWDSRRQAYQLVTSVAVVDELQAGRFPNQDQVLALLIDISLVPVEPAIIEIVETYIQRMVMPRDPTGDALHLALASYHKCDFLLTWNVQHLANANKFSHIRRINALLGLFTPALVTPLELLA